METLNLILVDREPVVGVNRHQGGWRHSGACMDKEGREGPANQGGTAGDNLSSLAWGLG